MKSTIFNPYQILLSLLSRHTLSTSYLVNQTSFWTNLILLTLSITSVSGVLFLFFGRTDEVVIIAGVLQTKKKPTPVYSPTDGSVKLLLVKDGQYVRKGDVLLTLDDTQNRANLQLIKRKITTLEQKQLALDTRLLLYKSTRRITQEQLISLVAYNETVLQRFKSLSDQGATSQLTYLQQLNKLVESKANLSEHISQTRISVNDINQTSRDYSQSLADLKKDYADEERILMRKVVHAPVSGTVFNLQTFSTSSPLVFSKYLLTIVPSSSLAFIGDLPAKDLGLIRLKQPVEVSIDSYPSSSFGVLNGDVSSIGADALPPNPQLGKLFYSIPITISLSSQFISSNKIAFPLKTGMTAKANIKLRSTSYINSLFGMFKQQTQSLSTKSELPQ